MRISSFIDHTILRATTTGSEIQRIVDEAKQYAFAAVCVPPFYVKNCRGLLHGSDVQLATVVGFPFGYHAVETKVEETRNALADGAGEIDLVINIAALRNGDENQLQDEITAVMELVRREGKIIKVIIESGILTREEIGFCCELYGRMRVDYLKTSTGFADKSASVADVQLMRALLPSDISIKASGGIRDLAFARALVVAGATRLGCSSSVAIVKEEENEGINP